MTQTGNRLDSKAVAAAARYRWKEIHTAIGIDPRFLRRKAQPCPCCGGKDRFIYDEKNEGQIFYCREYARNGGGVSGFDLVMHFCRCDFPTALKIVAGVLGMDNAPLPAIHRAEPEQPKAEPPKPETDQAAKLAALWNAAEPLPLSDSERAENPVIRYLETRGLNMNDTPRQIRFLPQAKYWTANADSDSKPLLIGVFPCMIAAITDNETAELQGLHMTYLQPRADSKGAFEFEKLVLKHPQTGEALPAKKMRSRKTGSISGQSVKLYETDTDGKRIIIAEGIETALAARELFGNDAERYGLEAALSANSMAKYRLTDGIREIVIIADNDTGNTGMKAAHDLAVRAIKQGIRVRIWKAPAQGSDALDTLNTERAKQTADAQKKTAPYRQDNGAESKPNAISQTDNVQQTQ